jgi:hypothetical protein
LQIFGRHIRGRAAERLADLLSRPFALTDGAPPSLISQKLSILRIGMALSATDQKFLEVAISEAQAGFDEGGIPIGACLVSKDGKLIAKGRNLRMQKYDT